jgi:N-dimethylarginine dimethylaminohydrolase
MLKTIGYSQPCDGPTVRVLVSEVGERVHVIQPIRFPMSVSTYYVMSPPTNHWKLRGKANFRSQDNLQVSAPQAIREWVALADAIEERGGRVLVLVPPVDTTLTGLPYAAEAGQIVEHQGKALFLLPNMAVEHRRGEREMWRVFANNLGMSPVDLEGTWEAQGDVAWFRGQTLLFFGGRTDHQGLQSAARYLAGPTLEIELRQPAFHGNMAVLPLPSVDKMLVCKEVLVGNGWDTLVKAFGKQSLFLVTEQEIRSYATNGLPVGNDWLIPHLTPTRVREQVASWGMNIVELSMTELCEKAGGASRCLVSIASLDPSLFAIPSDHDYRAQRARILAMATETLAL